MKELKTELNQIVGQKVSFRRMGGNRLILYFGGEPGDVGVSCIWLDPIWRYEKNGQVIVGSLDIPWEADSDEAESQFALRFNSICNLMDGLIGSTLTEFSVATNSFDLSLSFSNMQKLLTFTCSTLDDEDPNWGFTDGNNGPSYYVSIKGVRISE
jgi:hypothetical protein